MGKRTPKGGQEIIDDSSSYNEEISEEEIEPPEDKEEDMDKESILHHTRRAEEGINQTVTWYDTRHTMREYMPKKKETNDSKIRNC